MSYQQVKLQKGKATLTTWIKKDARIKPGVKIKIGKDDEYWSVLDCYGVTLKIPPLTNWKVGGLIAILLMCFISCAGRRVTVTPTAQGQKVVLEDRTRDAFLAEFADLDAVLKSNLSSAEKMELAGKIIDGRIEALKELLLREADKGKNIMAGVKELSMFIAALLGIVLK